MSRRSVRAVDYISVIKYGRSNIDDLILDHSDFTGTDAVNYACDCGFAFSDNFELYNSQDLLLGEVIAGLLHSRIAESLVSVVRYRYCTAFDVRENVGEIFLVSIPSGCDLELGLIIEDRAGELGELALLVAVSGSVGQAESNGNSDLVAYMSVDELAAVEGEAGLVAGYGSRCLVSDGSGCLIGSNIFTRCLLSYGILAILEVACVPSSAVSDTGCDINCLAIGAVEYKTLSVSGNLSGVGSTSLAGLCNCHSSTGPARGAAAIGPVVYVYVAQCIIGINIVYCDHLNIGLVGSRIVGSSLVGSCLFDSLDQLEVEHLAAMIGGAALFSLASHEAVEPILIAVAIGTEVNCVLTSCETSLCQSNIVIHAIRIPISNIITLFGGLDCLDHVG